MACFATPYGLRYAAHCFNRAHAQKDGSTLIPAGGKLGVTSESFNGSMRDELLNGEIFYTLAEAQILIEAWRRHYNTVRPHSSLGYRPPVPETETPPYPASGSASLHLRPDMAAMRLMH